MMWTARTNNELYVFHNGKPIYKRWDSNQPSLIFNEKWPNEWIV